MKIRFGSFIAPLGAIIGAMLVGRASHNPPADTLALSGAAAEPLPEADSSALLRAFLVAMQRTGDHAQEAYEAALAAVRAQPEATITEVMRAERLTAEEDYPTRWALIYLATELRHPAALPYLSTVVQTRIPRERSPHPHSFSTVTEETILRTTAVDGVGHLAAAGVSGALDALVDFLREPSLSIRRASVQAILATPDGQSLRARIAAALPPEQQFLLDLRRLAVNQVPQIADPRQYLASSRRGSSDPPPPLEPASYPRPPRPNDAPRIR